MFSYQNDSFLLKFNTQEEFEAALKIDQDKVTQGFIVQITKNKTWFLVHNFKGELISQRLLEVDFANIPTILYHLQLDEPSETEKQSICFLSKIIIHKKGEEFYICFTTRKNYSYQSKKITNNQLIEELRCIPEGEVKNSSLLDQFHSLIRDNHDGMIYTNTFNLSVWLKYYFVEPLSEDKSLVLRARMASCFEDASLARWILYQGIKLDNADVVKEANIFITFQPQEWLDLYQHVIDDNKSNILKLLLDNCDSTIQNLVEPLCSKLYEKKESGLFPILMEHSAFNGRDQDGKTPLLWATLEGDLSLLQKRLEAQDIFDKTFDGKNILHLAVCQDIRILKTVLNHPKFDRKLLSETDKYGNTPYDILEKSQASTEEKFNKKFHLYFSGTGLELPDQFDIGQFNINDRIICRLHLLKREVTYFDEGGLCNGYSFLHNFYVENGLADYFYATLILISLWKKDINSLNKEIPTVLPQAQYYKNFDELIEQWTNDIFLTFGGQKNIQLVIPKISQTTRHLQFDFMEPQRQKVNIKPITIYDPTNHKDVLISFISLQEDINKEIAKSKTKYRTPYILYSPKDLPSRMFISTIEGKESSISLNELVSYESDKQIHNFDVGEIADVIALLRNYGIIKDVQPKEAAVVNKKRMAEILKYLIRLPEKIYIDIGKTRHSTTFRMLDNQKICFYDCNDETETPMLSNDTELYQTILKKNGHWGDEFCGFSKSLQVPPQEELQKNRLGHFYLMPNELVYWDGIDEKTCHITQLTPSQSDQLHNYFSETSFIKFLSEEQIEEISAITNYYPNRFFMRLDAFRFHIYHFNSLQVLQKLENFQLFKEEEFPKSLAEARNFQQNSPNGFTQLHLAIIAHDKKSVKRIVSDGFVDLNSQDIYEKTALELAITNSFIDAACLILDQYPHQIVINSLWIETIFFLNQHAQFKDLLFHKNALVNRNKLAEAAFRHHRLDAVVYLLENNLINSNDFIQQALLDNDLPAIKLLLDFDAQINYPDSKGNTALHYAMYMLNENCCYHLVRCFLKTLNLFQINKEGKSPLDILFASIKDDKVSVEDKKQIFRILKFIIKNYNFDLHAKEHKKFMIRLFEIALTENNKSLFDLLLKTVDGNSDILNHYVKRNGMRVTLLHIAILSQNNDFTSMLLNSGANLELMIKNENPSFSTNPLIGKTGTELMHESDYALNQKPNKV